MTKTRFVDTEDRNTYIVNTLLRGNYTLQKVADDVGLTRERIRQIYKKETGRRYVDRRIKHRKDSIIAKLKYLEAVKFDCVYCGQPVIRRDAGSSTKFCPDCRVATLMGSARDINKIVVCKYCKVEYHPYRNWRHQGSSYCSRECYYLYRRKR